MRLGALALAALLILQIFPITNTALAESGDIYAQADAQQQRVEEAAAKYNEICEKITGIEEQIVSTEAQIKQLEQQIPAQKARASTAMEELYRTQCSTNMVLELLFGAKTFNEYLENLQYLDRISAHYSEEANALSLMNEQLLAAEAGLSESRKAAETEKLNAEVALIDAKNARDAILQEVYLLQQAEKAEAERIAAEAAAAEGAAEIAAATPGAVDMSGDRASFIAEWAPRINAYMDGSPMAGTGEAFAAAAWDYNVDPRWSPAISLTESGKGKHCFLPFNAWGWGSKSWPDWNTAINEHVRGLARGYGYTISIAGAQKYCPPNWEHWYYTTLNEMNRI
jgi:peptidoglycan hydrolase CwlO-like protein